MTGNYSLPTTIKVRGEELAIRTHFADILKVFEIINDPDRNDYEKYRDTLKAIYIDWNKIKDSEEAFKKAMEFISCGAKEERPKRHILMDWEQDFKHIVSPINRVLGYECRAVEYLHWWTFLGAYYEIGECYFASLVAIRAKQAKGKPLDKWEKEFMRDNRSDVHLKRRVSENEQREIDEILGL